MNPRFQDEVACANLCADFANHIDARRYGELLDLFTEDGTLDRMGTPFVGRREIERFLAARPADVETRHLCTNIRVSLEGDDVASGFSYALFFQGFGAGVATSCGSAPAIVEYHDRFARTPHGWRISKRRIVMSMRPAN